MRAKVVLVAVLCSLFVCVSLAMVPYAKALLLLTSQGGGGAGVFDNGGVAWTWGNKIQAENYDLGGEGKGFHQAAGSCGNTTVSYRAGSNPPYLSTTADLDGASNVKIGCWFGGGWENYTVNVPTAGSYQVDLRIANGESATSTVTVLVDGVSVATISNPTNVAGNWDAFTTNTSGTFSITAGHHVIQLSCSTTGAGCGDINSWQAHLPTGGTISADSGIPYSGSVPAPAQLAGFTHLALNADFTNSSYTPNVAECGSPPDSQNAQWHIRQNDSIHGAIADAPCSRAQITTISGTRLLHLWFNPSDYPSFTILSFNWPADTWAAGPCVGNFCAGGPNGKGLYQERYTEITFRTVMPSTSNAEGTLPFDFWQSGCGANSGCMNGTNNNPGSEEIDLWEFAGTNDPTLLTQTNQNPGFASFNFRVDSSNFHTIGTLVTSDGTHMSTCTYVDGGIATHTTLGCSNSGYALGSGTIATGVTTGTAQNGLNLDTWVGFDTCYGGHPGCITSQSDLYVQSIRMWECASYWTSPCFGPFITSENQTSTRFAWLQRAISWIFPEAKADVFDSPQRGEWVCPDGKSGLPATCMPPEFRDKNWWESCIPGRSDCITSEHAVIGWDGYRVKRGHGYCYTEQPYTCDSGGALTH